MNKKPVPEKQKPYAQLINKKLSDKQIAQLDHNIIRFVELLIKLDKQEKESKNNN